MELVKQQTSSKRRLKLGDIAEHLQVKKFVVRAWEKELGLAPASGLYGAEAIELFKKIKQLALVEKQSFDQIKTVLGEAVASVESEGSMIGAQVTTTEVAVQPMAEASGQSMEIGSLDAQTCEITATVVAEAIKRVEQPEKEAVAVHEILQAAAANEVVPAEVVIAEFEVMVAPAESYDVSSQAEMIQAAQVVNDGAQEKFLAELAFFKQELVKFRQLLST
jgi:DNA-binding transcriptional MerR regulator